MGKPKSRVAMRPFEVPGDVIEERRVDNPHISWAQFLHEIESGEINPGALRARVNVTMLMGGFAKFRGTEAQQRAAAKFKNMHERSQVGSIRAIDPSVEAVDGGGNRDPELGAMSGAEARAALDEVLTLLGRLPYRQVEYVVVGEHGPTAFARFLARSSAAPDGRSIAAGQVLMRRLVDRLACHWNLQSKGIETAA